MKAFKVCCPICQGKTKKVLELSKKLTSENIFGLKESSYHRMLFNCLVCDHYFNIHKHEKFLNNVYHQNYSVYSYKKINESFKKIISLPKKKSSNLNRVLNLKKFLKKKKLKIQKY